MIIELPLLYKIKCRRKHHRSTQECTVYELQEFELPEVDALEAPIAVKDITVGDQTTNFRYYDDSFWTPEYNGHGPLDVSEWGSHLVDKKCQKKADGFHALLNKAGLSLYTNKLDHDEYRDIFHSTKSETAHVYEKFLRDNIMIVDGIVHYRRDREPLFVLDIDYKSVKSKVVYDLVDEDRSYDYRTKKLEKDSGIYFRLDKWDDMRAYVEEAFPNLTPVLHVRPEILIDGIFDIKDEEISFMRQANVIINTHKSRMSNYPAEVGMACYALRDAYNACSGFYETTAEQIDEVIPHANHLAELLAAHGLKGSGSIGLLCKRWETRPIDISMNFAL